MGKLFHRLARECKGAVTVFVTLLLIPAVLVSGTGVDLARWYTAYSTVQDANQLAANSVLASYDALLQDLYGLFGVMKNDPEFAEMVDSYIKIAVFGENWVDRDMGTFQLFYGSDLIPGDITPAADKNLANQEVLRRQIEEYAKFRAPAIIVGEILDRLDSFGKVQKDAEVIKDKMEIDDKIEEIDKLYKRIYTCIQNVNKAGEREQSAMESVNEHIDRLKEQIRMLDDTRTDYADALLDENYEEAEDYSRKYSGIIDNIHALINGGNLSEGWVRGGYDENGDYQDGYWMQTTHRTGLNQSIGERKRELEDYISNGTGADDSLTELVNLCRDADKKKDELEQMVNDLEQKLNSGQCSDELKTGMTQPSEDKDGNPVKSAIDQYRDLLAYDLEPMAQAMYERDEPQIRRTIDLLDSVSYGDPDVGVVASRDFLRTLSSNSYPVDLYYQAQRSGTSIDDQVSLLNRVTPDQYSVPGTFEKFQSGAFSRTKNPEFYEMLERLYASGNGNDTKKDNIKKGLEKMLGSIQSQFSSFLEFEVEGARVCHNSTATDDSSEETDFGVAGDWGSGDGAKTQAKKALNNNLLGSLSNAFDSAANKILLLTYDSEMFSCYPTNRNRGEGQPAEKSMAGIPLGLDVNYYYQSELEYIYNGDLIYAENNLKAVTSMIFLVRFVFNYIASFTISEVNSLVNSVKASLSFTGPFAIVAGELVRLIMALGESVIDVSRLKQGQMVSLLKNNGTWRFSITGQLDNIADGSVGTLTSSAFSIDDDTEDDPQPNFGYKDYLRFFLLLKDGNTLAQRTAKLIELNVTNKRDNFGSLGSQEARENAMASADLFEMKEAVTDFSITTTVNLKMLFLSMPFAQRGVNGVVPPGTVPITATGYRGY